jgi:hypothetical protein
MFLFVWAGEEEEDDDDDCASKFATAACLVPLLMLAELLPKLLH